MNWVLSGFRPTTGRPVKEPPAGKDITFMSLVGPMTLMCLAPVAYCIFAAPYVFAGLSLALGSALGAS